MKRIIVWLLPVIDIFKIRDILRYYRSLGVRVPWKHAKAGMIERCANYLPVGMITGWILGLETSALIFLLGFLAAGPPELWLMMRGKSPWKFFKKKPRGIVVKIFLLEGYNVAGYYFLGAVIGSLIW